MAKIEKSVDVNVPVHTAYNQMTQFEDFPRFMEGVQEIRQLDETHLHWRSKMEDGEREWDAEITDQVPDKLIAWRNTSGKQNSGRVEFQPLSEDKARITLTMECEPEVDSPQTKTIERKIAKRTEEDLSRFKQMIETQGKESGAWRGEVHQAQVVHDGSQQDEQLTGKSIVQPATTGSRDASTQPGSAGAGQTQSDPARQSGAQGAESWLPKIAEAWEEPFEVMRKMTQEMDNFFGRVIGRPLGLSGWGQGGSKNWTPPVEVAQRDNQLIICAELPGIKREDVHVEIRNDRLTIEGDRPPQAQRQEQEYRRSERAYGHFYREIPLPEGVDPESAAASMHDGMLEITLPVTPTRSRGRRIDIGQPSR